MNSARAIAAAIRAGETSAVAETEAAIARIEAGDGAINAVVVRDFERARAAAAEADRRREAGDSAPLLGVPMTVKESFDVAGLPTSWGLAADRDHIARADAVAVQKLKAAGAIILGKTNIAKQLGDWQSDNPVYGRTLNPRDFAKVAGGSSGGSAAALAAGFVPLELGSDIGGSIRVPASFCGVWGHKPSWGAVPIAGHYFPGTSAASEPLGVAGPLARDADDLALALDVLADAPLAPARPGPAGWRILVLPEHPLAPALPEIREAVRRAGEALAAAGATVDTESALLPDLASQQRDYMRLMLTALARGAAGPDGKATSLAEWFDLTDAQFRSIEAWRRLFDAYDAVLAPVLGIPAFAHDSRPMRDRIVDIAGAASPMGAQFAYAGLATFPNLPATSAPVAETAEGLPIGLQVIADRYHDHLAIAIAKAAHDLMRSKT